MNWRLSSKEKPKGGKEFWTYNEWRLTLWPANSEDRVSWKDEKYWIYKDEFQLVLPPMDSK